jgi:Domain of unknown function (DUF4464)
MGSVQQDSLGDDDAKGRGDHEDRSAAAGVRLNQIARKFANYEDFLDSRVTETDMFYLEDRSIARTVKELSFHGNSEEITREQFDEKKSELAGVKKTEELKSGLKYLYTDRDVFLLELARREDANFSGRLVTVLYIRDRNAKGQEVSSYIDYAQRLREDNFENFFAGRQRLTSKTSDLSYFNWDTKVTHSNNSPNFDVVFHGHEGLRLKCRKDHRIIHLNPNRQVADTNIEDTTRTLIRSRNYAQVSIGGPDMTWCCWVKMRLRNSKNFVFSLFLNFQHFYDNYSNRKVAVLGQNKVQSHSINLRKEIPIGGDIVSGWSLV